MSDPWNGEGQARRVAHSLRFLQRVRVLIGEALITDSARSAQIVRITVIRVAAWTSTPCALNVLNRKTTNCTASPTVTPPQNYTRLQNPHFARF